MAAIDIRSVLSLVGKTTDPQIKLEWAAHVPTAKELPFVKMFAADAGGMTEPCAGAVEWEMTTKAGGSGLIAQGGLAGPISQIAPPIPIRKKAEICVFENYDETWDVNELTLNTKGRKVMDYKDAKVAPIEERIATDLENQLIGVPQNAADKKNIHGIFTYFQPTRQSDGTVIANDKGGHTGNRIVWRDGTNSTSLHGYDRANDPNDSNYNISVPSGAWGPEMSEAIIRTSLKTTFQEIPMLTPKQVYNNWKGKRGADNQDSAGTMMASSGRIFMGEEDWVAWNQYVLNVSPDDTKGDPFMFARKQLSGFDPKHAPLFDSLPAGSGTTQVFPNRPIVFLDMAQIKLCVHDNKLMQRQAPWNPTPFQVCVPRRGMFQLVAKYVKLAGGLIYRV